MVKAQPALISQLPESACQSQEAEYKTQPPNPYITGSTVITMSSRSDCRIIEPVPGVVLYKVIKLGPASPVVI